MGSGQTAKRARVVQGKLCSLPGGGSSSGGEVAETQAAQLRRKVGGFVRAVVGEAISAPAVDSPEGGLKLGERLFGEQAGRQGILDFGVHEHLRQLPEIEVAQGGSGNALQALSDSAQEVSRVEARVQVKGNMDAQVLVSLSVAQEREGRSVYARRKRQAGGQGGARPGAVFLGGDVALAGIDVDGRPVRVELKLPQHAGEARLGAREERQVIGVRCVGEAFGCVLLGKAARVVAIGQSANPEPLEQGLQVQEEEQGGQAAPLDGAAAQGDGVSGA